jgi:hypothetical protein
MIVLKIDVTKLKKERFFKGQKGTYCELVLIETPDSEYGDFMCKQGVTKEEREARVEMPILGNAKWMGGGKPSQEKRKPAPPSRPKLDTNTDGEDTIPF